MKQTSIAIAIMALAASSTAFAAGANVQGGSSVPGNVAPGPSTLSPLDPTNTGNAGISMQRPGGAMSATVDILGAPIQQATNPFLVDASGNRWAVHPGDGQIIAQVWAYTARSDANVYALRQVRQPGAPMPVFGGLVIGQVKDAAGVALPAEQGVYFGEWSEQSSPTAFPTASNNLNMDSASNTVWYVGDNAVTSMPSLVNATYAVVGIGQTGTDASGATLNGGLPGAPNLYQGTLTANYGSGNNTLNGSISRTISGGTQTVDFTGTTIGASGAFSRGSSGAAGEIKGQFYNDANALAGFARDNGTTHGDVAFGGSRSN